MTVFVGDVKVGAGYWRADGDRTVSFPYTWLKPGVDNVITVYCGPGSMLAQTDDSATVYAFGATRLESDPDSFHTGDPVTISAGDFFPGTVVKLAVVKPGTTTSLFTTTVGKAGADFTVTGTVTFPEDLPCGEYDVILADGKNRVTSKLTLCGDPTRPRPTTPPPTNPGLPHTGH